MQGLRETSKACPQPFRTDLVEREIQKLERREKLEVFDDANRVPTKVQFPYLREYFEVVKLIESLVVKLKDVQRLELFGSKAMDLAN